MPLTDPKMVVRVVEKYYHIERDSLKSDMRSQTYAEARKVAMYLLRMLTILSSKEIAYLLHKTHATVLHSIKAGRRDVEEQNTVSSRIVEISDSILKYEEKHKNDPY